MLTQGESLASVGAGRDAEILAAKIRAGVDQIAARWEIVAGIKLGEAERSDLIAFGLAIVKEGDRLTREHVETVERDLENALQIAAEALGEGIVCRQDSVANCDVLNCPDPLACVCAKNRAA